MRFSFLLALLLLVSPALMAQDGLYAEVKKVEGPADDVLLETADGDEPEIVEGMKLAEGTKIATGPDSSVIIEIKGTLNGETVPNAMLAIRHSTEFLIDRLVVEDDEVRSRFKVKMGEVRVKITSERQDLSTDMKVATPNATASVTGTDVNQIGFNANKGTIIAVASGSVAAARKNGTTTNVGGGDTVGDSGGALDNALNGATQTVVPIGMVEYEVQVGQLQLSGPARSGSDNNNASTNPAGDRTGALNGGGDGRGNGEPLPSRPGRINRR